jgi:hypothetical protein
MYKISLYLFLLKKYLFDWRQNSLIKKKKKEGKEIQLKRWPSV